MNQQYNDREGRGDDFGDGWATAYHTLSFPACLSADSAFRTAAIAGWVDLPGYWSQDPGQEEPAIYWEHRSSMYARQTNLLRCIFGNPFRPASINPDWLTWNGGTVPRLVQVIYDERRFSDLPVLADALEEAGCTNADILDHCRRPGEHVRGCWVVDLLLGKE
jgi:hypothetical protein